MKAPKLPAEELADLNNTRKLERIAFQNPAIPDYFDNGRVVQQFQYADEYLAIDWVLPALLRGEILTTVNNDGDFVKKLCLTADGTLRAKDFNRSYHQSATS